MRSARLARIETSCLALLGLLAASPAAADQARSILDLQPLRQTTEGVAADGTPIRLIDLNPTVGRWYLLGFGAGADVSWLHLETPDGTTLALDGKPGQLVAKGEVGTVPCAFDAADGPLAAARAGLPYAPACGGAVWVRKPARGARSFIEAATDVLRTTGGAGETLINFYKNHFNDTAEAATYGAAGAAGAASAPVADAPPPAVLAPGWSDRADTSTQLDIRLDGAPATGLRLGQWYKVAGVDGAFATVLTPEAAGADTDPGHANEAYFAAWDMGRYALRYALGTTHPMLNWSDRAPLPHPGLGPDGLDSSAPLSRVGMVPPYERRLVAGAFSGGFKREHGAFKWGPNIGEHYGFAEDGVVFSTLQAGVVTIYAGLDGMPHIRTFSREDARHGALGLLVARQAGYALVENGEDGVHAGDIAGNWSGSNDGHLLTMRAGVCVMPANGTSYLVYGVFSATTPHAMAATFRAFGCSDAALLDMNNPVLAYGAVYRQTQGRIEAEHLMKAMAHGDDGDRLKFVDEPDSRDFFYVIRRSPG